MIALSPEAEAQLDALIVHYEALGRLEASINLLNALERRWCGKGGKLALRARREYDRVFFHSVFDFAARRSRYAARNRAMISLEGIPMPGSSASSS